MSAAGNGAIPTYLVVVEFGAVLRDVDHRRLQRLAQDAGATLLPVRTDRVPEPGQLEPNRAFEFSGFQDGLQTALALTEGASETDVLRLVFVNDTVFRAHLPGYGSALLRALLAVRPPAPPGGACVGIEGPVPGDLSAEGRAIRRYVSTWAFAVCASRAAIQNLRFFEAEITEAAFAGTVWPGLPAGYRASIDSWLEPLHYLKGWYQAIPGRPLDAATRWRKRHSIYLEHTLALRAERAGIALLDIGATVSSPANRVRWATLRLADRLFVNGKKLQHRVRVRLDRR